MSDAPNEADTPSGNFINDDGTASVQPEGAERRSDAGVGGAVHQEDSSSPEETQDEPVLEQNQASTQDKIAGIVAQTRVDLGGETDERYAEVLRQRLEDAGIEMTDEDREKLAGRANPSSGGSGV